MLALNALVAGDTVLVPLQPEAFALGGLRQLTETITAIGRRVSPDLRLGLVLAVQVDGRTVLHRDKLADLRVAQHEPILALDGGSDGLDLIHTLLTQASGCLAPGGLILLEIEAEQPDSALSLAQRCFPLAQSAVHTDLAGLPRLLSIQT